MTSFPVDTYYNHEQIGLLELDLSAPVLATAPHLLHRFVLAPAYERAADGTFTVTGYSLIDRAMLPPVAELEKREAQS